MIDARARDERKDSTIARVCPCIVLLMLGCTAAPVRPVPKTPPIPTTAHETWRCVAPGVSVLVVGTVEPRRVEAGGAILDCYLVPLGE